MIERFARRLPFYYGWIVVAVVFVSMALGVNARTAFSRRHLKPPAIPRRPLHGTNVTWQHGLYRMPFTRNSRSGMRAEAPLARAVILAVAIMLAQSAGATTLIVTNNNDVVNGDTSSPQALIANPGPDGISLREAILAVNNVPGPNTITFAQALAGQTIALTTRFPPIVQSQIMVSGLTTAGGQPNITIDASHASNPGAIFAILASSFTMTGLNFPTIPTNFNGISIGGSAFDLQGHPLSASQVIGGVQIAGNSFSNGTGNNTFAIVIVSSIGNELVRSVTVANNVFNKLFESINLQVGPGTNNGIEDVAIYGNTFTNNTASATSAVELGDTNGSNNYIRRTRILQNTFVGNFQGIVLDINGNTQNSVIEDTLIARNIFAGNLGALGIAAGVDATSTGNTVTNTRIVNNVFNLSGFNGGGSGVGQVTDSQTGGANDQVIGVSFVNNTVDTTGPAGPPGAGFWVNNNAGGVSGILISNSIFWGQANDFKGVSPSQVFNSIINQSGFSGVNGNIGSDPLFVNPSGGDFHLQPGSPAIGAGTATGAPFGDVECKVRASPPAIGAYEPGNNPSCTGIVPVAAVLPASRSVEIGTAATAFATILNTGTITATACGLVPSTSVPASFAFQTTDPTTNGLTGTSNMPVNIPAGAGQTYVFGLSPGAAMAPTDVALEYTCANTLDVATIVGINTLLASFSSTPVPDMIAVGLTPSNDGFSHTGGPSGTGLFAIAAANVGASATLTAQVVPSNPNMPLIATVCQTNPSTGQCLGTPAPTVTTVIAQNQNSTWSAFLQANGPIAADPASFRVFFEFVDSGGRVRGSTSTAVTTQ